MINLSKGFVLRVLPSAPYVPVNGTGFCLPEHFYFVKDVYNRGMVRRKREIDMLNGPLVKGILLFAMPLMLSNLLQIGLNAADTIIVGKFSGQHALAAVGATGSIINLVVSLFNGIAIGANILIASLIGKGDRHLIKDGVHTSYFIAIVGGVVLMIAGSILTMPLLHLINTPDDIISLSALYMRIYFVGALPLLVYNFGAAILRSKGDTARPARYLMISGVVNVLLNLLTVVVLKWSVAGVAVSTVISEMLSAYLVTRALMKEEDETKLVVRDIRMNVQQIREVLKVGIPTGLQSSMWGIPNMAIQSAINSFGSIVVAGDSAALNLESFVYIGMGAIGNAAVTFISQNYGAKNKKRIGQIITVTTVLIALVSFLEGAIIYGNGSFFLSLYTNDPLVVEAGKLRLAYVTFWLFLNGILDIPADGLRGMGYGTLPTLIMFIGIVCVRVVYVYTVFTYFRTMPALYLCYPLSWIITMILQFFFFFMVYRKMPSEVQG